MHLLSEVIVFPKNPGIVTPPSIRKNPPTQAITQGCVTTFFIVSFLSTFVKSERPADHIVNLEGIWNIAV